MHLEPKLYGFSGAGHKVEFAISKHPVVDMWGEPVHARGEEITALEQYAGFLECKKVGVEQTVNSGFKARHATASNGRYRIPFGSQYAIRYAPRGMAPVRFLLNLLRNGREALVRVHKPDGTVAQCPLAPGSRFVFALTQDGEGVFVDNDGSLRDVGARLAGCKMLEIFDVTDRDAIGILNDCLAGPQTPEKAKQASFVALDARKRRLGTFDRREREADFVSILVLTEASHWEAKSIKMIEACIDHNLVVSDEIVIAGFRAFEDSLGDGFYEAISKESYRTRADVRALADGIVRRYSKTMFFDLSEGSYRKIVMDGNHLAVTAV